VSDIAVAAWKIERRAPHARAGREGASGPRRQAARRGPL